MHTTPIIVGIDEAGRGPLAGPVVAGACHIPCEMRATKHAEGFFWSPHDQPECVLGDSKQLSEQQRETAFTWITANCAYGIGISSAEDIDRLGILGATEQAMNRALEQLQTKITPTYLLVDGRDRFWFDFPHSSVIRGDSLECCIAAGSILAKVTRDKMMCEYAKEFSNYGFEGHKGYASPEHFAALEKHGPCAIHRQTFLGNFFAKEVLRVPSPGRRRLG